MTATTRETIERNATAPDGTFIHYEMIIDRKESIVALEREIAFEHTSKGWRMSWQEGTGSKYRCKMMRDWGEVPVRIICHLEDPNELDFTVCVGLPHEGRKFHFRGRSGAPENEPEVFQRAKNALAATSYRSAD